VSDRVAVLVARSNVWRWTLALVIDSLNRLNSAANTAVKAMACSPAVRSASQ
jgi:hypothetical protein